MAKKLLLLVLIFASLTLADWTVETVASSVRDCPDIAFDSANNPGIAIFNSSGLRYYYNDGSWNGETATGTVYPYGISLGYDSQDDPHIGFIDEWDMLDDRLMYSSHDGSSWTTVMLTDFNDMADLYNTSSSIYLVGDDRYLLHDTYFTPSRALLFYNTGMGWFDTDMADTGSPNLRYVNSAVCVNSSGDVFAVYGTVQGTTYGLSYSIFDGSSSTVTVLQGFDAPYIGRASCGVDASDNYHIAYLYGDDIRYGLWNGSTFDVETAHTLSGGTFDGLDMAITPAGDPFITFTQDNGSQSEVFCLTKDGSWTADSVTGSVSGELAYSNIAVDSGRNVGISYTNDTTDVLHYAYSTDYSGIEDTTLSGRVADEGVMLNWESVGDELLGFNLYRDDMVTPLNGELLSTTDSRWLDSIVVIGEEYEYRLEAIELDGTSHIVGDCVVRVPDTEAALSLSDPYPNPAVDSLTVSYTLATDGAINLSVYDLSGRLVETLISGNQTAGRHSLSWNASGVATGAYLIRLEAAGSMLTKRAVISR